MKFDIYASANGVIAQIYGALLSLMHVGMFLFLILLMFQQINPPPLLMEFGISTFWVVLVIVVVYVLLVGFLATTVSIHEQLVELNKNIAEFCSSEPSDSPEEPSDSPEEPPDSPEEPPDSPRVFLNEIDITRD